MAEEIEPTNEFSCPECGQAVRVDVQPAAQLIECPACAAHFVVPGLDGSTEVTDAPAPEHPHEDHSDLDSLRMRHIVVVRRAAMRSRTYCIVGAAASLIGAIQLVILTVREVRWAGWNLRAASFIVMAVGLVYCMIWLMRRAAHWNRESRPQPDVTEPQTPPDFSTLSDGSQHARNLEQM